ncbi:DsbA family protein [Streptomyces daliensis]|uniref:DsbA family protein n=1 Tax=Streptomyces daliensis TaxID=299421 RepID=A0A8T4J0A7_9ACTN|nr:DsbA family protein [Streptomyces daliensis]
MSKSSSPSPSSSSPFPSRTPSRPPSSRPGSRKGVVIGVIVAVVALLAGWLSQFAVQGGGGASGNGGNATVESDDSASGGSPELMALARRADGDPLAMGKKDAPVVMIEYADFGCSFCGKFARDTEPKLVKEYVEAGVLRIEWRNFPIFGKGSEEAALAGWAAGQQGRFWQFHEAVYADEKAKEKGFGEKRLRAFAKQAGVPDLDRFDRDRESSAAQKALGRDQEEGYGLGASSTPAFLVNGEPIAGAQPDEVFTDAIERAAKAAKKKGTDAKTGGGKEEDDGSGEGESDKGKDQ